MTKISPSSRAGLHGMRPWPRLFLLLFFLNLESQYHSMAGHKAIIVSVIVVAVFTYCEAPPWFTAFAVALAFFAYRQVRFDSRDEGARLEFLSRLQACLDVHLLVHTRRPGNITSSICAHVDSHPGLDHKTKSLIDNNPMLFDIVHGP